VARFRIGQSGPIGLIALAAGGLLLVAGCGTEPPPDWQWWRSADSAAVQAELAAWRGFFDAGRALANRVELGLSAGLSHADSTSSTGATLYKFAHLISFEPAPGDTRHADDLHFGVAVDTVTMTDTFCQVDYWDSLATCRAKFTYDSLWVVTFYPDTQPDSTIVWRVLSSDLVGDSAPRETTKTYDWAARRVVFLPKDSGAAVYHVRRVTGFWAHVPSSQDAPGVTNVVLTRPGHIDTIFSRVDSGRQRGLYNLKSVDSLYTIQPGEQVGITVNTSTPDDTTVDRNRFFLSAGATRADITSGPRQGTGSFSLPDTGYQHVFIEVVPQSSLLYRDAIHKSAVWAIPLRVQQ
jgi:hypothetical protein